MQWRGYIWENNRTCGRCVPLPQLSSLLPVWGSLRERPSAAEVAMYTLSCPWKGHGCQAQQCVCVCLSVYPCVCVFMYVCVYLCMYPCVCLYRCVPMSVCVSVHWAVSPPLPVLQEEVYPEKGTCCGSGQRGRERLDLCLSSW